MSNPPIAARLTISVAMCTYNGSRYLPEQLQSFLNQRRPPDEVIVCDDGSSDDTADILHEFASIAPFPCRIHHNSENLGYTRNFTQAVNLCSCDIIALSDQDDVWYGQKLARLEELFAAHPNAGGVFTNGDLIDIASQRLPGDLWSSFAFDPASQRRVVEGNAVAVLLRRNVVTGMTLAFCKRWREKLDHIPPHWPHDFWLALMLAAEGHLLACPERLVAYRVHTTQQVGVPITRAEKIRILRSGWIKGYTAASRERNAYEYMKDAIQFEALLEQAKIDPLLAQAPWLPQAAEKARLMRRVVDQQHSNRVYRWISALSHWNSYRLYAPTGLRALLRDLIL